jgi:hypothetical protein
MVLRFGRYEDVTPQDLYRYLWTDAAELVCAISGLGIPTYEGAFQSHFPVPVQRAT